MGGPDAQYREWANRRVGTTIKGVYHLDALIGLGGMAAVYAATMPGGRRVAVKLLHPDLNERADLRVRFHREAMAANAVKHPGAVEIVADDFTEDGVAFIVMELLEGQVVEYLWQAQGKRLPAPLVLGIAREVCEVLIAAHRAGIVHRDIKPENLFLTNDGRLKVLDFGLARLRDLTMPSDTHTGMVFGTPAFMPPEQASGRTSQIDERTDLWALGATMFTLLSGEVVHEGESLQHIVMLAASLPARPLSDVLPDAHPVLANLVDRTLTWDMDRRWPNAVAMRDAILSACRTLFGEERPDLIGADELTLTGASTVSLVDDATGRDDEVTGADQTLATLEPPVSEEVTQRHSQPVVAVGDVDEVTNVRSGPAPDAQENTSVMNIDLRGSMGRVEVRSDLDAASVLDDQADVYTRSMPAVRTPTPTVNVRSPGRSVLLPWILAGVATVIAFIAVWVAISSRHGH